MAQPLPGSSTTLLGSDDLHLFNEGTHLHLYRCLGAHPRTHGGTSGVSFGVWAPDADEVSVVGDFNSWQPGKDRLAPRSNSGIWEGFIAGVKPGDRYKYQINSRYNGYRVQKADPFAFRSEMPPQSASIVWDLEYEWADAEWMANRAPRNSLNAPISIYEMHFGSWVHAEGEHRSLSYREMAPRLASYLLDMGFTHVEFLPLAEHPFYGSWGYQVSGYFAPTARYGTPQDLMYLVDYLHQQGLGVIFDWVPSHFPRDEHGLGYFDGTHLYEHADPRRGVHKDWDSFIFNYSRNEVQSFLLSSAIFLADVFHADGIRVDAVASMLYRDYSRKEGEWIPNEHGGREDLDAINFLRKLNSALFGFAPGIQTFAEESTAWPMVSRPTYVGGLGFGLKWDMGWMHDTLEYIARDPIHRKYHHGELTFRGIYAFTENFVLPLSHDEVVHGKRSLLEKMPGDDWQKFANLRTLFAYQWAQPGKKLLFMGGEFAQRSEWNHDNQLQWELLQYRPHQGVHQLLRDLNSLNRSVQALHALDCEPAGFEWIDASDADQSTLTFLRKAAPDDEVIVVACNFTPTPRHNYRVGVPGSGFWEEVLNTDASAYGGSGMGNLGGVHASPIPAHGRMHSVVVTLPPLAVIFLKGRAA
ncbi:MAG TPA: 1,4-alpha-glucan branching protein GlgB [Tepidiformaceae bacterium]|nr:1,4-alpha-glucan branching protein GlgB [Tepidiformaceae bacterium]